MHQTWFQMKDRKPRAARKVRASERRRRGGGRVGVGGIAGGGGRGGRFLEVWWRFGWGVGAVGRWWSWFKWA